ncbi:MAG: hypothetical protein U5K73_09610 [Halofilum sp. (in: g-proteobacteria)]|nr:hypothetical protein [Halofilum sp. (in: g-proteobacteria)]
MPEHGHVALRGTTDQCELVIDPAIAIVDAHGSTHEGKRRVLLGIGGYGIPLIDGAKAIGEAAVLEEFGEMP